MRVLIYIVVAAAMALAAFGSNEYRNESHDEMQRRKESLQHLQACADSGNAEACFRLARVLETGDIAMPADSARAFILYRQAADSLYPPALNYLGYTYYIGNRYVRQDRDSALYLIEKAAMSGDLSAAANMGWLLTQRESGLYRDLDKAAYWLRRAAVSGNPAPLEALADISFERGDSTAAELLLDSAACLGYTPACTRLLSLRADSIERMSPRELMDKALYYYHNTKALQLAAGMFMQLALREDKDDTKENIIIKAHATAITAQLKSLGMVLSYDYDMAMQLFYRAACMGDPSAQYIVGETLDLYPDTFDRYGNDDMEADYWKGKAAQAGITDAHTSLKRLMP